MTDLLDCVGDIKESRAAMQLSKQLYSELDKYHFDLPENYNYQQMGTHSMPDNYVNLLKLGLQSKLV